MPNPRQREAERWYRQAGFDLKAARWNIEGGFHAQACFLAQQAGEKALKAALYFLGARRQALVTHALVDMTTMLANEDSEIGGRLDDARALDLHYVPSRYPNGLPGGYPHQFYAKSQADGAVAAAERILTTVAAFLVARGGREIIEEPTATSEPPPPGQSGGGESGE
jgi:HEPN domain-containing protein